MHGDHKALHSIFGVALFALSIGKQLDSLDIAVAIHHAASHLSASIRLGHGNVPQTRHEKTHDAQIADQPKPQRQQQPWVGAAQQDGRPGKIDDGVNHQVHHFRDGFPHCQCGLHHFLRYPPGKLILIEREALAEHMAMREPAANHRVVTKNALVGDQRLQQHQQRQAHHH